MFSGFRLDTVGCLLIVAAAAKFGLEGFRGLPVDWASFLFGMNKDTGSATFGFGLGTFCGDEGIDLVGDGFQVIASNNLLVSSFETPPKSPSSAEGFAFRCGNPPPETPAAKMSTEVVQGTSE